MLAFNTSVFSILNGLVVSAAFVSSSLGFAIAAWIDASSQGYICIYTARSFQNYINFIDRSPDKFSMWESICLFMNC